MKKIDFNADWEYEVLTNRAEHPGREKITLPHDAMLHEKRTENSPGAQIPDILKETTIYTANLFGCPKTGGKNIF